MAKVTKYESDTESLWKTIVRGTKLRTEAWWAVTVLVKDLIRRNEEILATREIKLKAKAQGQQRKLEYNGYVFIIVISN